METYFYIDGEYNYEFYFLFHFLFCMYRRQLEFGCIVKIKTKLKSLILNDGKVQYTGLTKKID